MERHRLVGHAALRVCVRNHCGGASCASARARHFEGQLSNVTPCGPPSDWRTSRGVSPTGIGPARRPFHSSIYLSNRTRSQRGLVTVHRLSVWIESCLSASNPDLRKPAMSANRWGGTPLTGVGPARPRVAPVGSGRLPQASAGRGKVR